jgi:Protein of unknown function (DUF3592)
LAAEDARAAAADQATSTVCYPGGMIPSDAPSMARPPPAPRPVPNRARGWNATFLSLFGGIWGGVGLVLAVVFTVAGGPVWNDWILDSRGVRADARPFDVQATSTRRNRSTVYEIDFRFADLAGRDFTGSAGTTNPSVIASARKGSHLPIEYDPVDPTRSRLVGESASVFGAFVFLPLGFFVIGAGIFVAGLVSARRSRAIYRDGEVAEARVVAVEQTASTQNRVQLLRVRYELQTPAGPAVGAWKTLTPPKVGETIWVIYDPARPERNVPARV